MSSENGTPITASEFTRWMNHIDRRFDGIHVALVGERERVNEHAERIATLEAADRTDNRRTGVVGSLSGILGGLIAGFVSGWTSFGR